MANARWINVSIIVGSMMFMLGLVLTRRMNPWGFGAGVITASFWNALILFRSPVGTALVHGDVSRPDVALQLFAALGHFVIIVACLVGFGRLRPTGRRWAMFFGGGVIAVAYLLVMVWTVGPPEGVEHIKRAFGVS